MRSRELQRSLANVTGRSLSDVDKRCRQLRVLEEISTGPRGLAAPHMTIAEAAAHVMCMVSRKAPDAAKVMRVLLDDCKSVAHPLCPTVFKTGEWTLGMMVIANMNREFDDPRFLSVEMHEDGKFAWVAADIGLHRGVRILFTTFFDHLGKTASHDLARYEAIDFNLCGNRFVISALQLEAFGEAVVKAERPAQQAAAE